MSIRNAMQELHVCRATVYVLIRAGVLEKHVDPVGHARGGQRVWFDSREVRTLAEERKTRFAEQQASMQPSTSEASGWLLDAVWGGLTSAEMDALLDTARLDLNVLDFINSGRV